MNTQTTAMPGSLDSRGIAAVTSATRPFYWSVRRELFENRSIYIAPLVAAVVFVFGFFINTMMLRRRMHGAWTLNPDRQHQLFAVPYELAATLIMGTAFLVGI